MAATTLGRPRHESIDRAILDAAAGIIERENYRALTIGRVAQDAATTRAAVYRRFHTIAELAIAVLGDRFGTDPGVDTGDLETDLRTIQRHRLELFTHPLIVRGLPGLIDDLSLQPEAARHFSADFLGPRRTATTRAVQRAIERGVVDASVDVEWISDLLTGPLLMRALLPGLQTIDTELIEHTVSAAMTELGRRAAGSGDDVLDDRGHADQEHQ
jgi:AcrR family transcriptional regulator